MLKSKYNILQLFLVVFMLLMFLGGLGIIINSKSIDFKKAIGLSVLMVFMPYMIYIFFKRSPLISFDENFINIRYPFKAVQYSWQQVVDIDFHTKEDYSILFISQSLEAMKIVFYDGSTLFVWNDMYRNLAGMRQMVAERTGNKYQSKSSFETKLSEAQFIQKKYAGNPLLTFNTILIIGIVGIFSFVGGKDSNSGLYTALTMGVVMFVFFGTQMHFFEIDGDKLIIRNHYFFWSSKEIYLSEIEEVAVETPHKRSTSLRIITKDFRSKLYGAGSLRSKNWNELRHDISSFGINVRWDSFI